MIHLRFKPCLLLACLIASVVSFSWMSNCSATACFHSENDPPAVVEEKLNVVIVMTDEHNFRTLGCYRKTMEKRQAYMWGPSVVETPHIDRIAQNGAMCTSFYASTPVCSPSRASFVSGLYPQATPVVTNNVKLDDSIVTFAEILKQQGYATGYAGKWHLDGSGKPQWAPKRNFGFTDNRFMFNRGHWKKFELTDDGPRVAAKGKNGTASYGVDDADEKTFSTDFLMDRTLEFIQENKDQPFCYMLSLPDPHGPDSVRAPYDTMFQSQKYEKPTTYEIDERTIPKWGLPNKRGGFGQSKYYGMVKCIDDNIGRLFETLEKEGLLDKTIIIFTADHGDLRGEHHRQNKGIAFEGSARVPFLISGPKSIKGGTIVDQALSSVDFAPSLLAWLGVATDREFHGRDASVLFNQSASQATKDWNDIAFTRGTNKDAGWLMAVTDRYKLVLSSQDEPWLFDLERDPDEIVNQRDNPGYRDIVQKLGSALAKYTETFDDPRRKVPSVASDLKWAAGKQKYPGRVKASSGKQPD